MVWLKYHLPWFISLQILYEPLRCSTHCAEDTMNGHRHGSIPHGTYSLVGQADNNKCQAQNTKSVPSWEGPIEHVTEELDPDWGHSSQGLENKYRRWEILSRQKEQHVQRPQGWSEPGTSAEPKYQGGWSTESKWSGHSCRSGHIQQTYWPPTRK